MSTSNKPIFPVLKTPDIVQCLDMLNIRITEADIQKPNPNTAFRLIEALASDILNVKYGKVPPSLDAENVVERVIEDTTDFPELHQDGLAMMMFFRQLSKIMRFIGVKNFSLKDITHPEPARMRLLLSAIINFARFREDRYQLFDELSQKTDQLIEAQKAAKEQNEQFKNAISTIKLKRSEEEPQVEELTSTVRQLTDQLRTMKQEGDALNADVSALKKEKTATVERLQNTQVLLHHSKQEITRLQSRIVRNPEELKRTIYEMNSTLQALKSTVLASERQNREIQMKIENLGLVEQDLKLTIKLLEDCEQEYKTLDDIRQKAYQEKDLLDRKQAELREFQIKEQQLKRQESAAQEKIKRLHIQLESKKEALESKLQKYRKEWEELGSENAEMQAQFDEFSRQSVELKTKINEMKKSYDVEITAGNTEVNRLKDDLKTFMSQVSTEMIEIDAIMQI